MNEKEMITSMVEGIVDAVLDLKKQGLSDLVIKETLKTIMIVTFEEEEKKQQKKKEMLN